MREWLKTYICIILRPYCSLVLYGLLLPSFHLPDRSQRSDPHSLVFCVQVIVSFSFDLLDPDRCLRCDEDQCPQSLEFAFGSILSYLFLVLAMRRCVCILI